MKPRLSVLKLLESLSQIPSWTSWRAALLLRLFVFVLSFSCLFSIFPAISTAQTYTQRVNAAGGAYTDGAGNVWSADQAYSAGSWGYVGGNPFSTTDPIANTNDDTLYQSERYGNFSYRFDVLNGLYDVTLHFAEIYWNGPGQRIFDVLIEGALVLDNYDIYAAVGHDVAVIRTFSGIQVQDGQLNIDFATVVDNAKVSAISVTARPTKLAITSVNGGSNPSAGVGFSVVVQAQDAGGNPANVSAATGVSLSLKTGTGTLGGTLTGTIAAGSSQVTISGVTYTKAESGVVLTATRTSGNVLTAGDSVPFSVNPGAASTLAFTTQPGNATAGSPIPGPPTVTVRDSSGNTVTSSTASITIAIGTNPGGGVLSGTKTKNATSGVASFSDLSINQVGNGYTLNASSAGLTGAASVAFNITAGSGTGTIAGTVTRASDGIPINGALVEALQGNVVKGSATTGGTGSYSIGGLAAGTYTVRASASTYATKTQNGVTVTDGSTTTVNFSLNPVIEIISPTSGTTINAFSVLVTGLVNSAGIEVGVNVNGFVAVQDSVGGFAAMIPVDSQTTSLTAKVTDTTGTTLGTHTIPVSVQPPTSEPTLFFRPSPALGIGPLSVTFTLTSLKPITQVELDLNGDGTFDFTGSTLQGQTFIFQEPGLYYPFVRVTDNTGGIHTATTLVQVFDQTQLDVLLQAKWQEMRAALMQGNVSLALTYIAIGRRPTYEAMFNALTIPLTTIDQILTNVTFVKQAGLDVEYRMIRVEGGVQYSDLVLFTFDVDGVWRIKFF